MIVNESSESFLQHLSDKIFENFKNDKEISFEEFWSSLISDANLNDNFFKTPHWKSIRDHFFSTVFLEDNISNELKFRFDKLIDASNAIIHFLSKDYENGNKEKGIKEYLGSYFELIEYVIEMRLVNEEAVSYTNLLSQLMTGYRNNSVKINGCFYRFFSPLILEKVLMIYDFTKEFLFEYGKIDMNKSVTQKVYRDLYFEKLSRLFFMNVIVRGEACICTNDNLEYPATCKRKNLSSVMMIKPIRWLDKIRAYVDAKDMIGGIDSNSTIKILVIGYVNLRLKNGKVVSDELHSLANTLSQLYPRKTFRFDVFLNKNDDVYNKNCTCPLTLKFTPPIRNVVINIDKVFYAKTFVPGKINRYILDNDIVLLLDPPNLYEADLKIVRDSTFSMSSCSNSDYSELYKAISKKDIVLPLKNRMVPIHNMISKLNLIGIDRKTQETNFHYVINAPLLKYIENVINSGGDDKRKDFHILYSSTSSIANSEFAEKNIAREERYKGKEFRLISFRANDRISTKRIEKYKGSSVKNYVVFSLWNLIKNIDISLAEDEAWVGEIGTRKKYVYKDLMNVFIKLSWNEAFTKFDYGVRLGNSENRMNYIKIKTMIGELLEIVLKHNSNPIGNCILNSFYNTLYSQIQFIDDAVFYCMFKTQDWDKIKPQVNFSESEFDLIPVLSVNQPNRWTIVRAIDELQKEQISIDQYYSMLCELEHNDFSSYELLNDIFKICKEYKYEKCTLYNNVRALLNKI